MMNHLLVYFYSEYTDKQKVRHYCINQYNAASGIVTYPSDYFFINR